MKYKNDESYMYFVIQANYVDKSGIYKNDEGNYQGKIEGKLSKIEPELWEIPDEENFQSTYLAQWDYKNSYYRISGKITQDELTEIIQNTVY